MFFCSLITIPPLHRIQRFARRRAPPLYPYVAGWYCCFGAKNSKKKQRRCDFMLSNKKKVFGRIPQKQYLEHLPHAFRFTRNSPSKKNQPFGNKTFTDVWMQLFSHHQTKFTSCKRNAVTPKKKTCVSSSVPSMDKQHKVSPQAVCQAL